MTEKDRIAANVRKPVADIERTIAIGTQTMVVGPYAQRLRLRPGQEARPNARDTAARLVEAVGLAAAINLTVRAERLIVLDRPTPATYLGSGKVEELKQQIEELDIGLVIMDAALSPVQQRNLERAWQCKVIDRTGLILEIFGRRARTREGRLQVELAHLGYQKSRLVRSWTHLERQRGGFGFLGGPGETQIEADRRIILDRMVRLQRELDGVKRTRGLHREGRRRTPYPIIALVGYTNAGKSTLFNRLTSAEVMAEDLLFATLDPTARVVRLPHGAPIILSDTVGFISDLPTTLVAAFRATLEDVIEADIVLHIRDVSHEDTEAQAQDVTAIMRDLGIDPDQPDKVIEVWNKIDQLTPEAREQAMNRAENATTLLKPIVVSALTGEGTDLLLALIEAKLSADRGLYQLVLSPQDGAILAWIYREGEVMERRDEDNGDISLQVRLPLEKEGLLLRRVPEAKKLSSNKPKTTVEPTSWQP